MSVRLKDVAERAGVSIRTVSNVVNDYPYVRSDTRARVQAVIEELGYAPNLTARQLRRGRTGMIALAVPDLTAPYFAELAGHVLAAAERRGLTVLIEQTAGAPEREVMLAQGPMARTIDGLLLSPWAADPDDLADGVEPVPLVLLGERIDDPRFDVVSIDDVAAAETATRHLLGSGRRRIAALGVDPTPRGGRVDPRFTGYQRALAGSGLDVDPRLVVPTWWFSRSDGYSAVRRLLESGARPDALFCSHDLLAHGALRALADAGIGCPHDIAVIGTGDIEENRYTLPSLTSIAPDKPGIAQQAVDLLVRRIDGSGAPEEGRTPGFSLSVRESAP